MVTTTTAVWSESYLAEARNLQSVIGRRLNEWADALVAFGRSDSRTEWAKDLLDNARMLQQHMLEQAEKGAAA